MSRVLLFVLLPVLAACAPPALTIATYAADGASYAATGKTMTDHGISVATARDCEIIARLLDGRPICIDRVPDPAIPVEDPRRSRLFLVVGSFSDPGNAEREARRHASLGARVIPAVVGGRRLHRVVVGPVSAADAAALGPEAWKAPARDGGAPSFARGR